MSGRSQNSGRSKPHKIERSDLIPDECWYDTGLEKIYEDEYSAEISDTYRKLTANKGNKAQNVLSNSAQNFRDWRKAPNAGDKRNSVNMSPKAERLRTLFSKANPRQYRSEQIQPVQKYRVSQSSSGSQFINYQMGFDEFNQLVSNPNFTDPRDELSQSEAYSLYDRPQAHSRGSVFSGRGAVLRSSSPMIEYIENERRLLHQLKNSKLQDNSQQANSSPKYVLVPIEDYLSGARKELLPIAPGIFSPNVVRSQILVTDPKPSSRHVFEASIGSKQSKEHKLIRQLSGSSIMANSISSAYSSLKQNLHQCSECHQVKSHLRLRRHQESLSFQGKPAETATNKHTMRSSQILDDSPPIRSKQSRLSVRSSHR